MTEVVGTNRNFDLPIDEIIEEAYENLGGEHISHEDMKHARRCLNLLFTDMQNRGAVPLASIQQVSVALVSSSAIYDLSGQYADVLDYVIRVSTSGASTATDLPIDRLSYSEYMDLPVKDDTGRPTHVLVDRQRDNLKLYFWPEPDTNDYSFKGWAVRRIANVDKSYQLADLPYRYLPAIVAGLTYFLASKRKGKTIEERQIYLQEKQDFKQDYLEKLELVLSEDRERVNMDFYPAFPPQLTG